MASPSTEQKPWHLFGQRSMTEKRSEQRLCLNKLINLQWAEQNKGKNCVWVCTGVCVSVSVSACWNSESLLAPQITWRDSSPQQHSGARTSACAGHKHLPGWHTGLARGLAVLGEEIKETTQDCFCNSKIFLLPLYLFWEQFTEIWEAGLEIWAAVCVCWHNSKCLTFLSCQSGIQSLKKTFSHLVIQFFSLSFCEEWDWLLNIYRTGWFKTHFYVMDDYLD